MEEEPTLRAHALVLSPELVAGYLDGDLPDEERTRVELHLASCAECRAELADIRQLQRRQRRRRLAVLLPAAAAAALVVALALPRPATTPLSVRGAARAATALTPMSPAPDAEVAATQLRFVWTSAGSGASYTLTLQKLEGGVVWTSTTADTFTVLPDSIALGPRQVWFWFVDALLPDGRSVATEVNRFTTAR